MSALAPNSSSITPFGQPTTIGPNEEVLSLDLGEDDFLYRIRKNQRIVYVSVLDGDIIPPDSRTDSFWILSKLRRVPKWEEEWKTMTVQKSSRGIIESTPDEFLPHGLDLEKLNLSPNSPPFYSMSDLTFVSRISDRLSRVRHSEDSSWILKIARFAFEIPALQREGSIYAALT